MTLVRSLTPGSNEHRIATNVLLLMQDGLALLVEVEALLEKTRRS